MSITTYLGASGLPFSLLYKTLTSINYRERWPLWASLQKWLCGLWNIPIRCIKTLVSRPPPPPNLTHWGEKEHLPNPYGKLKNNTAVPPGEIEELMTHMEEKKEKGVKLPPFAAAFQWNIFSS